MKPQWFDEENAKLATKHWRFHGRLTAHVSCAMLKRPSVASVEHRADGFFVADATDCLGDQAGHRQLADLAAAAGCV